MTLTDRIKAFARLGELIFTPCNSPEANRLWDKAYSAHVDNPWFTPDFCRFALESISVNWLNVNNLKDWVESYPSSFFNPSTPKRVAVIMAGNIPLVGFHDLLCVLLSGNKLVGKLSSKDGGLMQAVVNLLLEIEPRFKNFVELRDDKISDFDAVIATGSNNSARYFEYYFGKYPNIIRKNRNSIAILNGLETEKDLQLLADDIFLYFGLGCRSVSKIFVPNYYDFRNLFNAFNAYKDLINHNKYANNYEYYRALFLMNQQNHFDGGFFLVLPEKSLGSPVGVLYYEYYNDLNDVKNFVHLNNESIQSVISGDCSFPRSAGFGSSQKPLINDYADGTNTLEFLNNLK